MKLALDFSARFSSMKRLFARCEEITLVIKEDRVFFMAYKDSVCRLISHSAAVHCEYELDDALLGYSFSASLFLKLPANKDKESLDLFKVVITEGSVEISVNKYSVRIGSMAFNKPVFERIMKNMNPPMQIDVTNLYWLHTVGRHKKDSVISVLGDYAFCDDSSCIYVKSLKDDTAQASLSYAFPSSVLSGFVSKDVEKSAVGETMALHFTDGSLIISNLFNPNYGLREDFLYAKKHKARIKISLNLHSHKDFLKTIRGTKVDLNIGKKNLKITTEHGEELTVSLDSEMKVDIASTDFDKFSELSNVADSLSLSDVNLLKVIANEPHGVAIYVTSVITLISFRGDCFAMIPLGVSKDA